MYQDNAFVQVLMFKYTTLTYWPMNNNSMLAPKSNQTVEESHDTKTYTAMLLMKRIYPESG